MAGPVRILDYDPRWPTLYARECVRLAPVTDSLLIAVEHIGSTSVPGLAAKPTIDIMAAWRDGVSPEQCIPPIEALGYKYSFLSDLGDPGWHYFGRRDSVSDIGYHIHLVELGGAFWQRHLNFRDYLRAHPETAEDYARLKRSLAARYGDDRMGYCRAKTGFVVAVEERAAAAVIRQGQAAGVSPA